MKILYQEADLNLADHALIEIDSSKWANLRVDIHTVNIQGVTFSSFDEYAVEEVTEGLKLYCWHGPRFDYDNQTVLTGNHGHIWTFRPLFKDPLHGGAYNTNQTHETYFEPDDRSFNLPLAQNETRREWDDFDMPKSKFVKTGVSSHDDDAIYESARLNNRIEGWRGWTDGIPAEDVENDCVKSNV